MRKTFSCLAIVLGAASSLRSADKISYDELRSKTYLMNDTQRWSFTAITLDGKRHRGDRLRLESDRLLLLRGKASEAVPSAELVRFEVGRRFGQWSHRSLAALKWALIAGLDSCQGTERRMSKIDRVGC